jgi:hypothetical protein
MANFGRIAIAVAALVQGIHVEMGQQGDTQRNDGVRKLYTLEGLDSGPKRPVTTGHEFDRQINELERIGEREDIWHDLCVIARREGLLEIIMVIRGGRQ